MKVIYNYLLPIPPFSAMAAFGVILAQVREKFLSATCINHEDIHAAQAEEVGGWIIFYAMYVWQWVTTPTIKGMPFKYRLIPFEIEAHAYDRDLNYLQNRVPLEWKRYL